MTYSGRHDRQDSAGIRLVTAFEDRPASSQAQQRPGKVKATTKVKLNLHGLHDLHNRAQCADNHHRSRVEDSG
jgi:hypothetical protein